MDLTKRDLFSEIDEVMQATEKLRSKRLMRRVYDLGINQRNTETFPTLTSCNALMHVGGGKVVFDLLPFARKKSSYLSEPILWCVFRAWASH